MTENSASRSALTRKLSSLIELTSDESDYIDSIQQANRTVPNGESIISQDDEYENADVIISGWGCRSVDLADGRRQVFEFCVPGDIVCLQGFFLKTSDEDVTALGDVEVARIDYSTFTSLLRDFPILGAVIFWLDKEWSLDKQRLLSLGRRTARERISYFLWEHNFRLSRIGGGVDENTLHLPLKQQDIADALGLSAVHVSRVLKTLRDENLITADWSHSGKIELLDKASLSNIAGAIAEPQKFRRFDA